MLIRPRRTWQPRDFAQLSLLLGVGLLLHRQPLADIITIGRTDSDQSHIFLAPIVAGWLLWLRRSRLRYVAVQPSLSGPVVASLGWIVSWWGFEHGMQVAWHGGALLSLVGVLFSMTGPTPLRLFLPVFGAMLFMLPIPGELRHAIAYPLQELATSVTYSMLELIGVSALKNGNVLVIGGEQ